MNLDDLIKSYDRDVIAVGDGGSKLLAAICAPTLANCEFVEVLEEGMNGFAVLRIPEDHYVVVHSIGGNPAIKDLREYTASMVEKLMDQASLFGATPVAFADVVDSRTGDLGMIELIGNALAQRANEYRLAILNGENAILGNRVNCEANVSGTMISIVPKEEYHSCGGNLGNVHRYAVFDPKGRAVSINSDGVGTKTEFYERTSRYPKGLVDSLAMKVDDSAKRGAIVMAVSDVVEMRGAIPFEDIEKQADELSSKHGFAYIVQPEDVGERIQGFDPQCRSYNISGSAVCVIDEKRLANPLKPSAGDYLIAIRGKPNPRSNGITSKRKLVIARYGENYHTTDEGRRMLEFLAEPSTVFYPVFKALIDRGLATSVYHMSGGAYKGKLARPLAKHGLFARIWNLFPPDKREIELAGENFKPEVAYAQWPMGNEGFVTSTSPDAAMEMIRRFGLEAKVVGRVEMAEWGRTGVEIVGVIGSNRKYVYYSGRDAD